MWSGIQRGNSLPDRRDGKDQFRIVSACFVAACVRVAAVAIDQRQT
jgi:hypothetical protein